MLRVASFRADTNFLNVLKDSVAGPVLSWDPIQHGYSFVLSRRSSFARARQQKTPPGWRVFSMSCALTEGGWQEFTIQAYLTIPTTTSHASTWKRLALCLPSRLPAACPRPYESMIGCASLLAPYPWGALRPWPPFHSIPLMR